MILDYTAPTKDQVRAVNALIGSPFSLFQSLRLGGVGSHKMIVEGWSSGFTPYIRLNQSLIYGNIELREKGIILHLSHYNSRYSWVIPYYRLSYFQSDFFAIHAEGQFIRFRMDAYFLKNQAFFQRMRRLKEEFTPSNNL
jgi:hypothetical protein